MLISIYLWAGLCICTLYATSKDFKDIRVACLPDKPLTISLFIVLFFAWPIIPVVQALCILTDAE
jgi:hypothetical protein